MAADTQDSSSSQAWEAPQYEEALAHLERLQLQIDALRSTLPSLVAPFVKPATSKAQLFADIKDSALQATKDIETFRKAWSSEQTQQMFARSEESLEKNGDLTEAKKVPRYGWTEQ